MITDILARGPAVSVDEVVAMMTAIDGRLADADGLKWFNRLYLRVTLAVRAAVAEAVFNDPPFLERLDVVFGNLYFAALTADGSNPATVPSAWKPLFQARHRPDKIRLQFALAGMNAHINRDLPQGIVETFEAMGGGTPSTSQRRRDDFERVNDILEAVEGEVKSEFSTGLIGRIDALADKHDDVAAMWSVRAARAAAWTNAEVLWALKAIVPVKEAFFARLDSMTGLAGRGLLL